MSRKRAGSWLKYPSWLGHHRQLHPVGPCAKTRQKTNERIPGWFRADDRDLGIFAQNELKGRSTTPAAVYS
jgi:hypothetical protein